jgi:hypothetical protein
MSWNFGKTRSRAEGFSGGAGQQGVPVASIGALRTVSFRCDNETMGHVDLGAE